MLVASYLDNYTNEKHKEKEKREKIQASQQVQGDDEKRHSKRFKRTVKMIRVIDWDWVASNRE